MSAHPALLRIGIAGAALAQVLYLLLVLWLFIQGSVSTLGTGFAIASAAALFGLARRVDWARNLSTVVLFFLVFVVFGNLMPISGRPNLHFLEELFGFMPDILVLWLAIVAASAALLAPIAIMSLHQSYFRRGWW
jgi:hypothetical protein